MFIRCLQFIVFWLIVGLCVGAFAASPPSDLPNSETFDGTDPGIWTHGGTGTTTQPTAGEWRTDSSPDLLEYFSISGPSGSAFTVEERFKIVSYTGDNADNLWIRTSGTGTRFCRLAMKDNAGKPKWNGVYGTAPDYAPSANLVGTWVKFRLIGYSTGECELRVDEGAGWVVGIAKGLWSGTGTASDLIFGDVNTTGHAVIDRDYIAWDFTASKLPTNPPPTWESTPNVAGTSSSATDSTITWDEANATDTTDGDELYDIAFKATSTAPAAWTDVTEANGWNWIDHTGVTAVKENLACDTATLKSCTFHMAGLVPSTQYYVCVRAYSIYNVGSDWTTGNCATFTTAAQTTYQAYDQFTYSTLGTGLTGETFTNTVASGGSVGISGSLLSGEYITGEMVATGSYRWSRLETTQTIATGGTITFQIEVCATTCAGTYVGPDGTSSTFYDVTDATTKHLDVDLAAGTKFVVKYYLTRTGGSDVVTLDSIAVLAHKYLTLGKVDVSGSVTFSDAQTPNANARSSYWDGRIMAIGVLSDVDYNVNLCQSDGDTQNVLNELSCASTGVVGGSASSSDYDIETQGFHLVKRLHVIGTGSYISYTGASGSWTLGGATAEAYPTCTMTHPSAAQMAWMSPVIFGPCSGTLNFMSWSAQWDYITSPLSSPASLSDTAKAASSIASHYYVETVDRSSILGKGTLYSYEGTPNSVKAKMSVTPAGGWTGYTLTERRYNNNIDADIKAVEEIQSGKIIALWKEQSTDVMLFGAVFDATNNTWQPKRLLAVGVPSDGSGNQGWFSAALDGTSNELAIYYQDQPNAVMERIAWDIDNDTFSEVEKIYGTAHSVTVGYADTRIYGALYDTAADTLYPFFEHKSPTDMLSGVLRVDDGVRDLPYPGMVQCISEASKTLCGYGLVDQYTTSTLIENNAVVSTGIFGINGGIDMGHGQLRLFKDNNNYVYGYFGEPDASTYGFKIKRTSLPLSDPSFDPNSWVDTWFANWDSPATDWAFGMTAVTSNNDIYWTFRCVDTTSSVGCTTAQNIVFAAYLRKDITAIGTGSTVTVTVPSHGYVNGDRIIIDFTSTTPELRGDFTISNVTTNTFDVTPSATITAGCSSSCGSAWKRFTKEFGQKPTSSTIRYLGYPLDMKIGPNGNTHIAWNQNAFDIATDTQIDDTLAIPQYIRISVSSAGAITAFCADGTDVTSILPILPGVCSEPFNLGLTQSINGSSIGVTSTGDPIVVTTDLRTTSFKKIAYSQWNGTSWTTNYNIADGEHPVAVVNSIDDSVALIYLSTVGTQDIAQRDTTDGGATFGAEQVVLTGPTILPDSTFSRWAVLQGDPIGSTGRMDALFVLSESETGRQLYYKNFKLIERKPLMQELLKEYWRNQW